MLIDKLLYITWCLSYTFWANCLYVQDPKNTFAQAPDIEIGQVLHTFLHSVSVNPTFNIPFHSYDLCHGNTVLDLNRIPVFWE